MPSFSGRIPGRVFVFVVQFLQRQDVFGMTLDQYPPMVIQWLVSGTIDLVLEGSSSNPCFAVLVVIPQVFEIWRGDGFPDHYHYGTPSWHDPQALEEDRPSAEQGHGYVKRFFSKFLKDRHERSRHGPQRCRRIIEYRSRILVVDFVIIVNVTTAIDIVMKSVQIGFA